MINGLAKDVYENAKSKGFYDDASERNIGEMLCLIHSEVSEALEADRKNEYAKGSIQSTNEIEETKAFQSQFEEQAKNTFEDELADIVIRVMDLAAYKGIDLEGHIKAKVRYNKQRPHKHGKKY